MKWREEKKKKKPWIWNDCSRRIWLVIGENDGVNVLDRWKNGGTYSYLLEKFWNTTKKEEEKEKCARSSATARMLKNFTPQFLYYLLTLLKIFEL